MNIKHEYVEGQFNNFDYYELPSLPNIDIMLSVGHDKPNVYTVGFINERGYYQDLVEAPFDNKSQAVKFAKEILLDND